MYFIATFIVSQYFVTSWTMILPQKFSLDEENRLIFPLELLQDEPDNYSNDIVDSNELLNEENEYEPTDEEVLEALLTQIEYPEASEAIYNSLFDVDKKDESLAYQLSHLKPEENGEHPDISDRKQQDQITLNRRKRSIPPFVHDQKTDRRKLH